MSVAETPEAMIPHQFSSCSVANGRSFVMVMEVQMIQKGKKDQPQRISVQGSRDRIPVLDLLKTVCSRVRITGKIHKHTLILEY